MSYVGLGATYNCEDARHPFLWWVDRGGVQKSTQVWDQHASKFRTWTATPQSPAATSRGTNLVPIPTAMWNCMVAQQQDPFLKAASANRSCGSTGYLFTDDVAGCVNRNGITLTLAQKSDCSSGSNTWWRCSVLPRYMLANESKALSEAGDAETVSLVSVQFVNLIGAIQRAIEATQEWRTGWANVKGGVQAVARLINEQSGGHRLPVDEVENVLLPFIAKYYDSRRPAWDKILATEKQQKLLQTSALLPLLPKPATPTTQPVSKPKSSTMTSPIVQKKGNSGLAIGVGVVVVGAAAASAIWYLSKRKRPA